MDEHADLKPPLALTGATGFIGRELQRQLMAAGHAVRALVRPGSRHRACLLPGVDAREVALDDVAGLARALAGVAVVVHCAGAVRGRTRADFAPANVDAVTALCAAAMAQAAPPRLLLISSLAATRPHLSHYAASKHAGEEALRAAQGIQWTILRPPAVYGPGDREMLPLFRAIRAGVALVVGPRAQRLSLLHVSDLARAVVACLAHPGPCTGRAFDLDDGQPGGYAWPDIIAAARGRLPVLPLYVPRALLAAVAAVNDQCARAFRYAPMLSPGKVHELSEPAWLCDNSALHAATGWSARIRLRAGIRQLFGEAGSNSDDIGVAT